MEATALDGRTVDRFSHAVKTCGAKDGDLVAGEAVMCSEAAALPSCGMRHLEQQDRRICSSRDAG